MTDFNRKPTNDEKIAELAKDSGIPESYIRVRISKVVTLSVLQIASFEDCKRIWSELKDTNLAKDIYNILTSFIGPADLVRRNEVIELAKQSDAVKTWPDAGDHNHECQKQAKLLLQQTELELRKTLDENSNDPWTVKYVLTNARKYSEVYNLALDCLIRLRKIGRN